MGTGKCDAGGGGDNRVMDKYRIQRVVEILLVTSCHDNQYKL